MGMRDLHEEQSANQCELFFGPRLRIFGSVVFVNPWELEAHLWLKRTTTSRAFPWSKFGGHTIPTRRAVSKKVRSVYRTSTSDRKPNPLNARRHIHNQGGAVYNGLYQGSHPDQQRRQQPPRTTTQGGDFYFTSPYFVLEKPPYMELGGPIGDPEPQLSIAEVNIYFNVKTMSGDVYPPRHNTRLQRKLSYPL